MIKALGAIAAAAFALSAAPALALPNGPPGVTSSSNIDLVTYGCGRGFHPNSRGYCVPNVRYAPAPRPIYVQPRPSFYYNPGYYAPRATYYYHRPAPYYYGPPRRW